MHSDSAGSLLPSLDKRARAPADARRTVDQTAVPRLVMEFCRHNTNWNYRLEVIRSELTSHVYYPGVSEAQKKMI